MDYGFKIRYDNFFFLFTGPEESVKEKKSRNFFGESAQGVGMKMTASERRVSEKIGIRNPIQIYPTSSLGFFYPVYIRPYPILDHHQIQNRIKYIIS